MAIGISVDELMRARDSDVRYMRNTFPLLDLGWRREDCVAFLAAQGLGDTPKSSCIGFPIRSSCDDSECCRVDLQVACALGAEERRRGSK
jgi:hypothetical protein